MSDHTIPVKVGSGWGAIRHRTETNPVPEGHVRWIVEVCSTCGIQLGPGLNSPSGSGRCPNRREPGHHNGGTLVALDVVTDDAAFAARQSKG